MNLRHESSTCRDTRLQLPPGKLRVACADHPMARCRYVSPRTRAQRTFELLNLGIKDPLPWKAHGATPDKIEGNACEARVEITQDIREWDCKCESLGR